MRTKDARRFAHKFVVDSDTGCWEWTAGKGLGYGQFWVNGKLRNAHRVVYEYLVGPVPEGLELDHLCRNRGCCNPWHLEAVTHAENNLRGIGITAQNAIKTYCPEGHEYTEENTYVHRNKRYCRECKRKITREAKRRSRLAKGTIPRESSICSARHEYNGYCRICWQEEKKGGWP